MNEIRKVYAAYSKDDDLRLNCSSGAMISTISNYVLSIGGIVYGVAMSEDCYSAEFIRVDNVCNLKKIRGSKYLQAKVRNTFAVVKNDLTQGKYVLFTGTGCQINGLKGFIEKDHENLICIDIVCHGTPSPQLWVNYVKYQELKYGGKMVFAGFRNKERSHWNGYEMKEKFAEEKVVYISRHVDLYFSLFVKNICLRPSCYNCRAKSVKNSDVTVADFWGIEEVASEMNDDKGISLVILRTERGEHIFNKVSSKLTYKEVTYEDGVKNNKSEYLSYACPPNRSSFFLDMQAMPFEKLASKYLTEPLWKKYVRKIKQHLLTIVRS